MSIRVTKEGVLPSARLWTGTCGRCGCEVEAPFYDLDSSPTHWGYGCKCPTPDCGQFIKCEEKAEQQRYVDTDKVKYQRGEE